MTAAAIAPAPRSAPSLGHGFVGTSGNPLIPFKELTESQYVALCRRLWLLQNERVNNALIVAADAIEGATPHIFGNGGGAPPNFAREGTIAQQALELMRERGTPMSTEEIATALGKGKESLYNSLNNNANDKKKAKRLIESAGPGLWKPAGGF